MTGRKKVSTFRHWKQRFDPNASLIFRRRTVYVGIVYEAGDLIPEQLKNSKSKLRLFWDSKRIELAVFSPPEIPIQGPVAPLVDPPETTDSGKSEDSTDTAPEHEYTMEHVGAGWYAISLPDGGIEKVRGEEAAEARRDDLMSGG